ncbi:MAG: hypothetical protein IKP73_01700, partial [Bacteroidales bacterium]|nr:hypothetical protein [Bacteroidales bacterium]
EEYDEEDDEEDEGEYDDDDEYYTEDLAPAQPVEPADIIVSDNTSDPFAGQEMETIEQKLSRDPRWKKIKAKLNNI